MASPLILLTVALSLPTAAPYAKEAAELDKRLAAMRKAGEPTTLAELGRLYPDPAPGQNAAPLLTKAFALLDGREDPPALMPLLPIVGHAKLGPPNENVPPPMRKAIREYLGDRAEALELLHKAAKRKGCKFDLDFEQGLALPLPHLAKIRQACRVLALEVVERAEDGQTEKATDSIVALLRAATALRNEPILVSALVRAACIGIATRQIERWACRARPGPELLERIEAALKDEADPSMMEKVMVAERCFGMDVYQNQILKPGGQEVAAALGMHGPKAIMLRLMPPNFFKADMLAYVTLMTEYIEAARKPYPQSLMGAAKVGAGLAKRIPAQFPVARMVLPALGRVFVAGQEHMARVDSARVALAVLRYRAKHGRLPAKLDALVPDFLEAIPPDPFDGQPLRYMRTPDGAFVVYALGENGVDDGGLTRRGAGKPLDIGFRYHLPPAQF